ncbi:zf-TFIIB domain-containing protein [Dactylosporangium sp. NPDC005572]|uniref:zf-TFIIB domain-containing protein n=1 Tax=Dactylosporangium sp. NPDC005572 TaxID=3156889 RepID=UPI0033AA975B
MMDWFRRRLRFLGGVASAVSHADTGPFAGAPRNPGLRIDDEQSWSTIRYTTDTVAYTTIATTAERCPACGAPLVETHEVERHGAGGAALGTVRTCPDCGTGGWLRESRMPRTAQARERSRRNVV